MRWNSLVQSFGRNALSRAPNIFNRSKRNRSEPPTAGDNQKQNDWYYNHQTACNFPAELLYFLQFCAYVQRQFLIAKYSDPNGFSPDNASVKRFYSIAQNRFAYVRRHVENIALRPSHLDQSIAQGQRHKPFRHVVPLISTLKIFNVAKQFACIRCQTSVERLHFLGTHENPRRR